MTFFIKVRLHIPKNKYETTNQSDLISPVNKILVSISWSNSPDKGWVDGNKTSKQKKRESCQYLFAYVFSNLLSFLNYNRMHKNISKLNPMNLSSFSLLFFLMDITPFDIIHLRASI